MTSDKNQIKSGIYKKGEIEFIDAITSVKNNQNIEKVGAILTFTGIVRKTSEDERQVKGLTIDAYDELANKSIEKICSDIIKKYGIIDIRILHLKGEFEISDDLVYVIIASAHRQEGFDALRTAVERYKKEIEVWKRENYIDNTPEWKH